jgi:hydrogenase expression/formation protein HypD
VIDNCIRIAENENVIFTTFGDAMRVPGSSKSLLDVKAEGCDIRSSSNQWFMVFMSDKLIRLSADN